MQALRGAAARLATVQRALPLLPEWALPALPLVPLGQDAGGMLSGEYLQRSCRLAPDGRRPVSAKE